MPIDELKLADREPQSRLARRRRLHRHDARRRCAAAIRGDSRAACEAGLGLVCERPAPAPRRDRSGWSFPARGEGRGRGRSAALGVAQRDGRSLVDNQKNDLAKVLR